MSFENFSFTDNITVLDETHSTNDVARELARQGAEEFSCVLSKRQTGGRGRMGRKFFSYDGGVYLSVVLRPDINPKDSLFITVAAAVAMAEVIEEVSGKRALIKWVNDIYIDGKKVCGILTEGSISGESLQFAILGVGVNLSLPKENFPTEISNIAGSVFDYAVDKTQKNRFISLFLEK
ncbi:MAG: biotin--[acetyl-CoA-carboxylase] ligase, partial [Acutalibacteraceae bacterium]|nr:biotin--[acetyl-CoA-carboxylase] ligase [Acutalibacteraceae bacterium]